MVIFQFAVTNYQRVYFCPTISPQTSSNPSCCWLNFTFFPTIFPFNMNHELNPHPSWPVVLLVKFPIVKHHQFLLKSWLSSHVTSVYSPVLVILLCCWSIFLFQLYIPIIFPSYSQRWLVVWNIWIIFPFSWECHHPNWLSYFSEGLLNHQSDHCPTKSTKKIQLSPHLSHYTSLYPYQYP